MCGLIGVISKNLAGLIHSHTKIFQEMLYIDALRGEDATGVCLVTTKSGASVYKEASPPAWFVCNKAYVDGEVSFISQGRALLGHNRNATVGGSKDKHAHPFVLDDRYVFFHNGTLVNHHTIHKTEVDSEALGMLFTSCEGNLEQLSEAIHRVRGAYACVWYDADKNCIYMLRNSQRPLWLLTTNSGDLLYASEPWMAHGTALRNGQGIELSESLEVDTLYTIDLNYPAAYTKQLVPKKVVSSPVQHPGEKTTIVTNGSIKPLDKATLRRMRKEVARTDYHCFYPDDAVCSVENPTSDEVYDWLIVGGNPNTPGVQYSYLWKDKFEWETYGIYQTMAHGTFLDMKQAQGLLCVDLQNVKFVKTQARLQ